MITYPNAKINLGLNIVEKRPDGYHNLETVFYPINLQDALEVNLLEGEKEFSLKVSGVPIDEKIAREYIEKVGMSAYINAKPSQLSGGQKQMIYNIKNTATRLF